MRIRFRTLLASFLIGSLFSLPARAQQNVGGDCGNDRWTVKVLRDTDSAKVNRVPIAATIKQLSSIPIPEIPYPFFSRMGPHELTVYRVTASVKQIFTESDKDWHIVLVDPSDPSMSMIAEIPDPSCSQNLELKTKWTEARRVLHTIPKNGIIEIEGVGFFDFIHTQRGRAPNGFEIHPVLHIQAKIEK